jgi:3-carboxy-cis,cis-muconate cycloisomerase
MMQTEVGEAGELYIPTAALPRPCRRSATRSRAVISTPASVRQGVAALLDAMVEDHEPWDIEWITLPAIFTLTGGALAQACFVLEGLEVHADRMRANLDATRGLVVSEAVMMGLAPKMGRDRAHDVLYAIIHDPAMGDKSLAEALLGRDDVTADLGEAEIRRLTDPTKYLGLSEVMVDRVLAVTSLRNLYSQTIPSRTDRSRKREGEHAPDQPRHTAALLGRNRPRRPHRTPGYLARWHDAGGCSATGARTCQASGV